FRIKNSLLASEARPVVRLTGSVGPVCVHLPRLQARHKGMPVVVRTMLVGMERNDPRRLCGMPLVDKEQLYQSGTLGIDAEVDAVWPHCSSERSALTRCNDVRRRSSRAYAHS